MTWLAVGAFVVLIVVAGVKLSRIQDKGKRKEEVEEEEWP